MMLRNLFRPRPNARLGLDLYNLAVLQARQPEHYTIFGVEDRIDARFELYTLHVLILHQRLKQEGEKGAAAAQLLFDTYVSALDHTLRELGVGDVSVGKKMRKLGESLYGRMSAYEVPLRDQDQAALAIALAKNVYETDEVGVAQPLAAYACASVKALKAQDFASVTKAPAWSEIVR
jgi:cytochrome b pre-mRNA-processing protein 3